MIIKAIWEEEMIKEEIHIYSHPEHQTQVEAVMDKFNSYKMTLIDERVNRQVNISVNEIESIETNSHVSIVNVVNHAREYLLQKRLKELDYLNRYSIYRISNSVMINLNQIKSFQVIDNARLEVETKSGQCYIVSRYYAKQIREELSCSNN